MLDADGNVLGSFCVMDTVPRAWTPEQVEVLATLAAAASAQVQLLSGAGRRTPHRRAPAPPGRGRPRLLAATTLDDLTDIVVNGALPVLGADGGAVLVFEDDGSMRLGISDRLGEQTRVVYGRLAADDPLPACHVARTGERLQLPTQRSGLAFAPDMAAVYATTQRHAWAFTPLLSRAPPGVVGGVLARRADLRHPRARAHRRASPRNAPRRCSASARLRRARRRRRQIQRLTESLQQALLTPPPEPDHLQVVVRYRPATQAAQVGGDWYDAFLQPDGATMLVIGDVVGHDSTAAAQMGQLRGLVRALAYTADDSSAGDTPAAVLSRVERTARGLDVAALATVVLARVERVPDEPVSGRRTLRWSNAGHLPPVLLLADGSTSLLDRRPDLLLGVDPATARHDHTADLPDGSTLLLFTDGLVERRGEDLDRGIDRLRTALEDLGRLPLEELCDRLLDRLAADTGEDDVAVVAVRAHSEDRPRPPEAGPRRLPPGIAA